MHISVKSLSDYLNGEVVGDPEVIVNCPAKIEEAESGAISFFSNPKYEHFLYKTKASAVLVGYSFLPKKPIDITLIKVENVPESFGKILSLFERKPKLKGIDKTAIISETCTLGKNSTIGPYTVIGEQSEIGDNALIDAYVYIGNDVKIGTGVRIYSGARILDGTKIGDRCIIQANAILGSEGFGFSHSDDGKYKKIPQVGIVQIGNDVEVGANTIIDRATLGKTIIGHGVKLDNLIQIAHNVKIGDNTVIAAQTGIAGSTVVGKNCQIGGQVGIIGHIQIADGTKIQAQSGIASPIKEKNKMWYGSPALPYTNYLRSYAVFKNLNALQDQIRSLKKSK